MLREESDTFAFHAQGLKHTLKHSLSATLSSGSSKCRIVNCHYLSQASRLLMALPMVKMKGVTFSAPEMTQPLYISHDHAHHHEHP